MSTFIEIKQPAALNERGSREVNEDFIYPPVGKATANHFYFIICDGMGGQGKGDIAARMLAEHVSNYLQSLPISETPTDEQLKLELVSAEAALSTYMQINPSSIGMGTTLSMVYIGEKQLIFAWVGNSPIYYYRQGKDQLILVADISYGGNFATTPTNPSSNQEIAPIIYGKENPATLNIRRIPITSLQEGDYIFLASDGIKEQVGESTLKMLFQTKQSPEFLIQEVANLSRGLTKDDFSCYMLQLDKVAHQTQDTAAGSPTNATANEPKQEEHTHSSEPTPSIKERVDQFRKNLIPAQKEAAAIGIVSAILLVIASLLYFSLSNKGRSFESYYESGEYLMQTQDYERAIDTLQLALDNADSETERTQVRSLLNEANDRAADNNRSMSQLKALGDLSFKRGQWDQAVYYYEKARQAASRDTLEVPQALNENLIHSYINLGDFHFEGENTDLEKSLANYRNAMGVEPTDEIKREADYLRASVRIKQLAEKIQAGEEAEQLADNTTAPTSDTGNGDSQAKSTEARPQLPANPNKSNVSVPSSANTDANTARVSRSNNTVSRAAQRRSLSDGKNVFERAVGNNSDYEYKASASYLEKAGSNIDGEGAYMLGIMYHEGKGVPRNESKALQYAKISAQKGWPSGQYLYGHLLLLRRYPKDSVTAVNSLRNAAANNHEQAMTRLNELQIGLY